MNFTLLFSIPCLCFDISFDVDSQNSQHYFIFSGNDSSASLYRDNHTLFLVLHSESIFEKYIAYNVADKFTFTWNGYAINGSAMNRSTKSTGKANLIFSEYTFISPIVGTLPYAEIENVYRCRDFNYGLIALMIFGFGIVLKGDLIIKSFFSRAGAGNTQSRV